MKAGIYFPLFVVLRSGRDWAVYYLPTEFQHPKMFRKRRPLTAKARRAGWQGFTYDLTDASEGLVQVLSKATDRAKAVRSA